MAVLDDTPLGLPLPHPDNDPYAVDVDRIRAALVLVDTLLSALKETVDAVPGTVATALAEIRANAPEVLDTFAEVAAAIEAGEDAATALAQVVASKASTAQLEAAVATINQAIAAKADAAETAAMLDELAFYGDLA